MFLHTWHPHALIVSLGGLSLHWYGLTLALGALAGYTVIVKLGRQYRLSEQSVTDLFLWLLIVGLLGARLYHVTNEWAFYTAHPSEIFKVWNGGLAIHGGLLAGLITLWVFARKKAWSFWRLADILAAGVILGQAIGRWGNYFNPELFGRPTALPWGIPIDLAHRPAGYLQFTYFHPTFLYESLGSLAIFGVLWWLHRRRLRQQPLGPWQVPGSLALTYFLLYAVLRISTESLRIDRTPIIDGWRLPILTSALIILAAITVWLYLLRRHRVRT
jgi:phosphatidylglycerol:prolipoprotein diacylglycerol transferase